MKAFFTCLLMAFSLQIFAAEIKMAVITSEFDKNFTNYFIETNDKNHIVGMRYVTVMPNGGIFEDISVTAEQVLTDGAVIVERNGHLVVKLELENFSVQKGGTVILNYLYNGATGTRHIKKLSLQLINNEFVLFDKNQKINQLFLVANRVRVLGIVGVKHIVSSFKEPTR